MNAWTKLLLVVCLSVSDASYFEKKLLDDLLSKGHRKDMRPVLNDNDTVTVTIGVSLSQIIDVALWYDIQLEINRINYSKLDFPSDEKNQIMTTSVWTRQEWYNPYLRWNKSNYGNISSINVLSTRLWLPDLVLYNNADQSIDFRGNLDKLSTRVQLFHDGTNKWLAPVMLRSECNIDVKYFPFDSQTCIMKFGSWTYDGNRMDVRNESDQVDLQKYVKSAEWHLEAAPVKRNVLKYFCCPEPYPDVTFYFIIHRRSLFYLSNLILPLVMISVLIVFVFSLPPQSGERISLSITLLLSMMVFMLFIAETIPATSEDLPLIAKFYIAVMVEMALALIVTCYVLKCYHSCASEVPRWMRKILVTKVGKIFGVTKSERSLMEEKEGCRRKKQGGFSKKMMNHSKKLNDMENGMGVAMLELNDSDKRRAPLSAEDEISSLTKSSTTTSDVIAGKILGSLEIISGHFEAKDGEEKVREQWLVIATVMDRLAMCIFTIAIAATIFIIFYQAPGYVP